MIILFDAYMQYDGYDEIVKKDLELTDFFFEITKFVMERLEPLRDEIYLEELEEQFEEEKSKATIIYVLPSNPQHVSIVGYSDELKQRMVACFSDKDMQFFIKRRSDFIKIRNN